MVNRTLHSTSSGKEGQAVLLTRLFLTSVYRLPFVFTKGFFFQGSPSKATCSMVILTAIGSARLLTARIPNGLQPHALGNRDLALSGFSPSHQKGVRSDAEQ